MHPNARKSNSVLLLVDICPLTLILFGDLTGTPHNQFKIIGLHLAPMNLYGAPFQPVQEIHNGIQNLERNRECQRKTSKI